ncbi:MAG: hypothetical protein WC716_04865 [Chitinophagaceae bacterium]|jgi:hypothetical protein
MKKIFFCAIAMLNAFFAQAQSKDRDVIAGSGGFVTTPIAIVSYTLGETAIDYLSASGAIASQGFQQASNTGASIYSVKNMDAAVSTYPNPFLHFVEIKTDKMLNEPVFQLADATGKMIQITPVEMVKGKHWRIEIPNIATGNYWLNIIAEDKKGTYILMHIAP